MKPETRLRYAQRMAPVLEWLPNSGLEPADFPMFEQYLNDPRSTPAAQLQTRICLPVK
ncbi:GyrI-like domain-containing protein [Pandoraea fibrosis]|uniref:AraC family transcriptional regulator n=1 Tax=Pandoraea fibrosis TaxID=1891094 RepID=A0A5E4WXM2_9BURK|nr:GyrI-like domain-containing protein [Pandoraea fibrosis]QHE93081.1 hypothetical protein PJ20_015540 [Pandoraea fibrosis]QHF13360.1 hypothetical protein PI93_012460 [Pandoraea fibrosis]VVE27775.1 AraC family transcriptional regulator [Pandoraea fibrosis]